MAAVNLIGSYNYALVALSVLIAILRSKLLWISQVVDCLTFDNQFAARHRQHPLMPISVLQPGTQAPCRAAPAGSTSLACETALEYGTRSPLP